MSELDLPEPIEEEFVEFFLDRLTDRESQMKLHGPMHCVLSAFAAVLAAFAITAMAPDAQAATTNTLWSTSSAGWTDTTTWEWSPSLGPAYYDFYIHMWYSGTNCPTTAHQYTRLWQDGAVVAEMDQYGAAGDWTVHVDSAGKIVGFNRYMSIRSPFRIEWQGNRPACIYHVKIWQYS